MQLLKAYLPLQVPLLRLSNSAVQVRRATQDQPREPAQDRQRSNQQRGQEEEDKSAYEYPTHEAVALIGSKLDLMRAGVLPALEGVAHIVQATPVGQIGVYTEGYTSLLASADAAFRNSTPSLR